MNNTVTIKVNTHGTKLPERIAVGDWIDLRASSTIIMSAGESRNIPMGVSMELPEGYEAHLLPRSSTFKTWGIIMSCSMGIIDNSYNGDNDVWSFPAIALRKTTINKGDRIAQFRVVRIQPSIEFVKVKSLGNNSRGGFGSTGVK